MIPSDRTRVETYQFCPRKRWWGFEYQGWGLERTGLNLDLLVGIYTHLLLADVLTMAKVNSYTDRLFAEATVLRLAEFESELRARGIALELESGYEQQADGSITTQESQLDFIIPLYSCWIEQSVTAWAALRLPVLLNEYEIVAIEEEFNYIMAGGVINFMTRPDVVLKRRMDGELFILNFKTVGEPNQWWQEQWPLDMQTLSEVLPVEAKLGQRVSGVLIEGLVKGGKRLQYPPRSGNWWINSPLVWMWKQPEEPPFPAQYAAKYEWTDEMGNNRRLGKGWVKQPVWQDDLQARGWLQWLRDNDPELLRAQFVQLPPILRSEQANERWLKMVEFHEAEVRKWRESVTVHGGDIDVAFPMYTSHGNCIRPSRCEFYNLCHGVGSVDPLHSGYQRRSPNHVQELEYSRGTT